MSIWFGVLSSSSIITFSLALCNRHFLLSAQHSSSDESVPCSVQEAPCTLLMVFVCHVPYIVQEARAWFMEGTTTLEGAASVALWQVSGAHAGGHGGARRMDEEGA